MKLLISSGDAKNTEMRSPIMPAGSMTGLPGRGPVSREYHAIDASVLPELTAEDPQGPRRPSRRASLAAIAAIRSNLGPALEPRGYRRKAPHFGGGLGATGRDHC
jgi:hypothetical protein